MCLRSSFSDSLVLQIRQEYPCSKKFISNFRTRLEKWGLVMSGTTSPTTRVRLVRSPLALMLGTYSVCRMMRRTRSSVSLEKRPFWLITRETVAVETPASRAISLMLFTFSTRFPPELHGTYSNLLLFSVYCCCTIFASRIQNTEKAGGFSPPAKEHQAPLYPSGFMLCHFQLEAHISSIPYCASQPSSSLALRGSA